MSKATKITIAVSTLNRLNGLKKLLNALENIRLPDKSDIQVVIADNSSDANAKKLCGEIAKGYPYRIKYFHVVEKGLVHPRNVSLQYAIKSESDYISFIDDDETPDKLWLVMLYKVIQSTEVAVVSGGVKPCFNSKPAWWISKGKFFEVMDYPEQKAIEYAHTSNAIVRLDVIRELGIKFDEKYNLSGGEDTELFSRIRNAGHLTYFTSQSVVYEEIVDQRLKLSWLMKRWYRTGNTDAIIISRKTKSHLSKFRLFAGGAARIGYGSVCALIKIPLLLVRNPGFYECLRVQQRGFGFISAILNISYQEYKNHRR